MLDPSCAQRGGAVADGSEGSSSSASLARRADLPLPRVLRLREAGLAAARPSGRLTDRALAAAPGPEFLPNSIVAKMDEQASRGYCGCFSADGSLFVAAFQGRQVRIYDVDDDWRLVKNVEARMLRWTITDCGLSPDQEWVVYTSIGPVVHLVKARSTEGLVQSISNITEVHEALDFDPDEHGLPLGRGSSAGRHGSRGFGIWSCKWSPGGREVSGGGRGGYCYR